MKLKDYLMLKQAFNTPPMPGPTQYVDNTSKPQIASTSKPQIANNQSVKVNKPTSVNGKPLDRAFSRYLGLVGTGMGGTLGYTSSRLRSMQDTRDLRAIGRPKTHSQVLISKLDKLEPPQRNDISKRQRIRNERKREKALEYLEDTDRQAYLRYMFGSDYFKR